MTKNRHPVASFLALGAALALSATTCITPARAEAERPAPEPRQAGEARAPVEVAVLYTSDVSATLSGGGDSKARYADNTDVTLDADLDRILGIRDTTLHFDVLGNFGKRPNDGVGSLQGVDNIEVGRTAVRLFEAWAERSFGGTSVRLGLYDLNSEFYATDSSGLLIAPPFGIGSEMSATGRNGPSIFPSTSLAIRVKTRLPGPDAYAQVAVLNARAQTFGDPGGVDLGFGDGLLVVGEAGMGSRLRGAVGAWSYTKPSEALASLGPDGLPLRARSWGLYGLAEYHFASLGRRELTGFARGGLARGRSNLFADAFQAGVLLKPVFAGREGSAFSLGYHRAVTSKEYRAARLRDGESAWRKEQGLEVTYSDVLTKFLTLQPDLQLINKVDEAGLSQTALHATLRISIAF